MKLCVQIEAPARAICRRYLHICAAMRGQTFDEFQKTRNAPTALDSVADKAPITQDSVK
jgi:hypothetical protein